MFGSGKLSLHRLPLLNHIYFFILFVYYVSQGIIEVESDNVFKLAANALQVSAFNSLVNMH